MRPAIFALGEDYNYISWDYCGIFQSDTPKDKKRLSIRETAIDSIEVLKYYGYQKADIMIGHSLGVQVVLETALLYPDVIKTCAVFNGSHGHVLKYFN